MLRTYVTSIPIQCAEDSRGFHEVKIEIKYISLDNIRKHNVYIEKIL